MTPQELDEWRTILVKLQGKTKGFKRRPANTKDLTDQWANSKNWPHTNLCHSWYEPDPEGWYECINCHEWTKRPELFRYSYCCSGKNK